MKIEAVGLGKRFSDGTWGLRGVDLSLQGASFTVVSGHNGSGKTQLARHFLGLEQPDEGKVLVDGRELGTCLAASRRRIAFVFQEPEHQILGLTVREDAEFTPRRLGYTAERCRQLADAALERVGLLDRENELCASLSGGEKRRLAVASVLVTEPELIILDEPFNDLDWPGVQTLLSILIDLHARGIGLMIISHDLEKCLAHADRLVVMRAGSVVADDSPAALWERLGELGLRRPGPHHGTLQGMTWLA